MLGLPSSRWRPLTTSEAFRTTSWRGWLLLNRGAAFPGRKVSEFGVGSGDRSRREHCHDRTPDLSDDNPDESPGDEPDAENEVDDKRNQDHCNTEHEEFETMTLGESPTAAEALDEILVLDRDEDGPEKQRHEQEDARNDQRDESQRDGDPENDPPTMKFTTAQPIRRVK